MVGISWLFMFIGVQRGKRLIKRRAKVGPLPCKPVKSGGWRVLKSAAVPALVQSV
jgi:hypothetical protein